MNLIDCTVTKVLSEPRFEYGKWWVNVEYDSWGSKSEASVMLNTEEEAKLVGVGYEFLS
jgi:hypothetical protein